MKLDINGKLYDYDPDVLTLGEAFQLKARTGWGIRAFYEAYVEREPAAYAWIAYIALRRAGEKPVWEPGEDPAFEVDLAALIDSIDEASKAAEPDPTVPADPETASG